LHLLHPFMPFVTEEIAQALPHTADSLVDAPWPRAKKAWTDAPAEQQVQFLQEVVVAIRNLRSAMNLPPAKMVSAVVTAQGEVLGDLENTKKKLMNQDFLAKARPDVVQRERDRLEMLDQTVAKLKRSLDALTG